MTTPTTLPETPLHQWLDAVDDADGNGEGGAALAQQYVGQVAESVRAVMR